MHEQRGGLRLVASIFANDVRASVRHDRPEVEDEITHRAVEIGLVGTLANARAVGPDRQHPAGGDIGDTKSSRPVIWDWSMAMMFVASSKASGDHV